MIGQLLLGRYQVVRPLDEGGMSTVYLARPTDHPDREVAAKVLKESLRTRPKVREHFRREIHITSRFHHPHAVAYVDAAPHDPVSPVLVMEYLRGLDLNHVLRQQGRLPAERAARLMGQLCEVLQAAHDAGIVHRDVKPANLMIVHPGTPQETLKLMDFGLAKMKSLLYISPEELADHGVPAAGTPEYMCPEQARGGQVDPRSDLYSAGAVLFEMLTGRRVFEGLSVKEMLRAHAEDAPPTFAEVGVAHLVPAELEPVVHACLAKNPADRPQSAGELALRLEQALGRKIFAPLRRPGSVHEFNLPPDVTPMPPPRPPSGADLRLPGVVSAADRHAVRQTFESDVPESMAMLKLKGFIHDLGGEILESVPGMIRVRLGEPEAEKKKPRSGLFAWADRGRHPASVAPVVAATDLELQMERNDPARPSRLTVTLVMRPVGKGLVSADWRNRCGKIGRDLQGYLMGR
jgi:serine/threonine-protein kinase